MMRTYRCKHDSVTPKIQHSQQLKQISKMYTQKTFSVFEQAFMNGAIGVCIVEESRIDENHIVYATQLCDATEDLKHWFVTLDLTNFDVDCSCKGFQTKGILCKHILRVYNHANVKQIPSQYILNRFTLKAKKSLYLSKEVSLNDFDSNLVFQNHMMRCTYDLTRLVEDCKIAKEYMHSVMIEVSRKTEDIVDKEERMKKRNSW